MLVRKLLTTAVLVALGLATLFVSRATIEQIEHSKSKARASAIAVAEGYCAEIRNEIESKYHLPPYTQRCKLKGSDFGDGSFYVHVSQDAYLHILMPPTSRNIERAILHIGSETYQLK